ncbi:MAG TPA: VOC family protein [Dissulfurispiraceae bacterium]|nr:VOC family protein [Dissulfurispiraceae bacterium]
MMLTKITPTLTVEDIKATIAFYQDLLGFELVLAVPSLNQIDWALMKCGEVEIMFQTKVGHAAKMNQGLTGIMTFHLEGEGVKELYDSVKNRVKIMRHLYPTFYGMNEFSMMDCNGIILVFSEKIKKTEEDD